MNSHSVSVVIVPFFHVEGDATPISLGSNIDKGGIPENWWEALTELCSLSFLSPFQATNPSGGLSWDGEDNLVLAVNVSVAPTDDKWASHTLPKEMPPKLSAEINRVMAAAELIVRGLKPEFGFLTTEVNLISNPDGEGLIDAGPLPSNIA